VKAKSFSPGMKILRAPVAVWFSATTMAPRLNSANLTNGSILSIAPNISNILPATKALEPSSIPL
jgi:hypothetical protein